MNKLKNILYIIGFSITIAGLIWNFSYSYGVLNEKIKKLENDKDKINKITERLEVMSEKLAKLETRQEDMKEDLKEIKAILREINKKNNGGKK